jgi:hypothetical protein
MSKWSKSIQNSKIVITDQEKKNKKAQNLALEDLDLIVFKNRLLIVRFSIYFPNKNAISRVIHLKHSIKKYCDLFATSKLSINFIY